MIKTYDDKRVCMENGRPALLSLPALQPPDLPSPRSLDIHLYAEIAGMSPVWQHLQCKYK